MPVPINGEVATIHMERTDFDPFDTSGITDFSTTESSKTFNSLPMYEYNVTAGLDTQEKRLGVLNWVFTPNEVNDVYVYIPSMNGFLEDEVEPIRSLYTNCKLALISNGQLPYTGGCSWES